MLEAAPTREQLGCPPCSGDGLWGAAQGTRLSGDLLLATLPRGWKSLLTWRGAWLGEDGEDPGAVPSCHCSLGHPGWGA